jgi:DNA-binding MarR family transcriptional regulator
VTQDDLTVLYLIKQVELAVRSRLDEAVSSYGLTALQYTALTVLERHPGMTAARLARNSFVRAQSMAQTITFLESRGLIVREPDPEARRQNRLTLTPRGRQVLEELSGPVADIESLMLSGLAAEETTRFRAALRAARLALGGAHPH